MSVRYKVVGSRAKKKIAIAASFECKSCMYQILSMAAKHENWLREVRASDVDSAVLSAQTRL